MVEVSTRLYRKLKELLNKTFTLLVFQEMSNAGVQMQTKRVELEQGYTGSCSPTATDDMTNLPEQNSLVHIDEVKKRYLGVLDTH